LLASVLSIAAADYACCPYDEYGVPDSGCSNVLTEKSPFADLISADNGGSIVPEESYACKAWEANAGAAIENHKGSAARDWGSCGFQRHFPWFNKVPTAATDPLAALGLFDAANSYDPNYKVFGTGGTFGSTGTNWNMLSLTKGSFSNDAAQPITGDVHLGAVCKLFVPVQKEYIRQVSIAGVHINNARIFNGASYAFSAEMNAVVVGGFSAGTGDSSTGTAWSGSYHAGTAYCFSVVNIAEFMTNRANLIANANVAGTDARTAADDRWYADDQGLQYKDADGSSVAAQFGTIWPGSAAADPTGIKGTAGQKTTGQHKVNLGSNFDVVVHFDSAWCSAHWELIDMQKSDDHGAGTNYQLAGGHLQGYASNGGTHPGAGEAKMDAWDKRLPAGTGSCGLCKDRSSVSRGPSTSAVVPDCVTNSWSSAVTGVTTTMGLTEGFNYHSGGGSTCTDLNSYPQSSNAALMAKRWPNAGAWAAFYSFVTCANADYMIYGEATRTVRTVTLSTTPADHLKENKPSNAAPAESATEGDKSSSPTGGTRNNDNRMVIVGGWHQDYRHGTGACVRFNLRQVGEHIQYCADGDEEEFNAKNTATLYKNPTGDTQAWSQNKNMRCTWNWNYNELSNGGFDAEAWFDSTDPLHMQVWETNAVSQEDAEKFIDEPAPGAPSAAAAGYQAAVLGGTLTSDVVINVMIQERPRDTNGVAHTSAFVKPTSLDMDSDYASASAVELRLISDGNIADFPIVANLFDGSSKYATSKITLACKANRYNGGNVGGAGDRMRDAFPDCFFGDEIHGQWQWTTGLADVDNAANTAVWRFYAMLQ